MQGTDEADSEDEAPAHPRVGGKGPTVFDGDESEAAEDSEGDGVGNLPRTGGKGPAVAGKAPVTDRPSVGGKAPVSHDDTASEADFSEADFEGSETSGDEQGSVGESELFDGSDAGDGAGGDGEGDDIFDEGEEGEEGDVFGDEAADDGGESEDGGESYASDIQDADFQSEMGDNGEDG